MRLFIDFETRSKFNLRTGGLARYATHPSTELLCIAYGIDKNDVRIWRRGDPLPTQLFQWVLEAKEICAHNVAFEKWIWREVAHKRNRWPALPEEKLHCTAAKCAYNNRPRSLDKAGEVLKIKHAKDKEGHKVMMKLTKPNNKGVFIEDPALFEKLYTYCIRDVVSEMEVDEKLLPIPGHEFKVWQLDRTVNERGCPIDRKLCEAAADLAVQINERGNADLATLTNDAVTSASQVATLLKWCQAHGCNIANMTKGSVAAALEDPSTTPEVREALLIRQTGAPAAIKKFSSAVDYMQEDDRAREQFFYYKAGTGRWAGKGIQLHNLFRESTVESVLQTISERDLDMLYAMGNPMQLLQTAVRGMVCAPDGKTIIFSDFSAIEARVLPWLAMSKRGVEVFARYDRGEGLEPYRIMGGKAYGKDPATIGKHDMERTLGKAAVLGLGFGMGSAKFQGSAKAIYGLNLSIKMTERTVNLYRKENPEVVKFWRDLQTAYGIAAAGGRALKVGRYIEFSNVNGAVAMRLPNGRQLFYHEPAVARGGNILFTDNTGKRIKTWGGLLAENAVQATARDFMAEAWQRQVDDGFDIIIHVHDELGAEVDEADAERLAPKFHANMLVIPEWGRGCPIQAETKVSRRKT